MKASYNILLFFMFLTGCFTSCVDTITIDAEDESFLVINCELTKGNSEVIAHVSTSNNLNGTKPITNPEDAIINISTGSENKVDLYYDDVNKYYTNTSELFWDEAVNFRFNASIPGSIYPEATSKVDIEKPNTINNIIPGGQSKVMIEEKEYYQKTISILLDTPKELPAYYELILTERLTTTDIVDGEEVLVQTGDVLDIDNIEVLTSGAGILNMEHRCGVLIDQSRLNDDNELSFIITSPHPIQSADQVFGKINTILGSISKDHYDYHRAKSKTFNTSSGQFTDRPIWGNNITNGFGLFSSTTQTIKEFEI